MCFLGWNQHIYFMGNTLWHKHKSSVWQKFLLLCNYSRAFIFSSQVESSSQRHSAFFSFIFHFQAELSGGTGKQHATGPLGTHHSETLQGSFARRKNVENKHEEMGEKTPSSADFWTWKVWFNISCWQEVPATLQFRSLESEKNRANATTIHRLEIQSYT